MSSLPAFARRARLRERTMLAATVLAHLRESGVDSASCDQLADEIGVGRGRVIAVCDELAAVGYLVKDRGVVSLTRMALVALDSDAPEAA